MLDAPAGECCHGRLPGGFVDVRREPHGAIAAADAKGAGPETGLERAVSDTVAAKPDRLTVSCAASQRLIPALRDFFRTGNSSSPGGRTPVHPKPRRGHPYTGQGRAGCTPVHRTGLGPSAPPHTGSGPGRVHTCTSDRTGPAECTRVHQRGGSPPLSGKPPPYRPSPTRGGVGWPVVTRSRPASPG
ncbi:predicted protein [Streptomyces sp. SPB78]|nr:predicted protein [Streptomyces sp. SPB78]